MTRQLRIALASSGRFHLLDVARELHALGHEAKFYSYVPRSRARHFGLPDECHVSLLPFVFPAVAASRLLPKVVPRIVEKMEYFALNRAVSLRLQPCDVFVFMSGMYLEAAHFAKRRFGAKTILVRSSRHVLSQDRILAECTTSERPSAETIRRELAGYGMADLISIPSSHVEDSFQEFKIAKTDVIPYGVDLGMFPFRPRRAPADTFTFINVGHWSFRKGSDILATAIRQAPGTRLVHVGTIKDIEFPHGDPQFVHYDSVQQATLARFYAYSDAFALASREEGLSFVLVQALASGLPVICTDRTGGADLAHTPALAARLTVVPHNNVSALAAAMTELRNRLFGGDALPDLSQADLATLSWREYARRFSDVLLRVVKRGILCDDSETSAADHQGKSGRAEIFKH
jgi:glycosyltransferase involved in cell wall biosynthesis